MRPWLAVGITGSVGKTTTRSLTALALRSYGGAQELVVMLAASCTPQRTGARRVIQLTVYRFSPRHPPHGVPVLAA
jgi:UDP-N-acetylmuramate-alanine ligase